MYTQIETHRHTWYVYMSVTIFFFKKVMNLEENKVMEVHGRFGREKKKRREGDAIIM